MKKQQITPKFFFNQYNQQEYLNHFYFNKMKFGQRWSVNEEMFGGGRQFRRHHTTILLILLIAFTRGGGGGGGTGGSFLPRLMSRGGEDRVALAASPLIVAPQEVSLNDFTPYSASFADYPYKCLFFHENNKVLPSNILQKSNLNKIKQLGRKVKNFNGIIWNKVKYNKKTMILNKYKN